MAHDVFVSYATEDKAYGDAVCATLEARRIRCWIAPRDVTPGVDYGGEIVSAIGRSRLLVLVFSSHSNASPHVRREAELAVSTGIPILPLRVEDVVPSESLQYYLAGQHWLNALTPPLEAHLEKLADAVRHLLSQDGDSPLLDQPRASRDHTAADLPRAGQLGAETLSQLSEAAESAPSPKERTRAIQLLAIRGGRSAVPRLTELVLVSSRGATRREAMKQLAALGGAESVRALKEIADHHRDDGVRGAAVELVVQAEGVADPEWLEGLLTSDPGMGIRYRLLEALAREGWSNRLDMGDNNVRQFIVYLRSLADVERHPDIRHLLVSIVAHLCGSESWTREWVLRKARDAEGPYYKIRGYAIGLSVWHDDGEFAEALSNCPTDVTGSGGEIFVQWAEQGEWERYRFHMGGWGPKM